MTVLGTSPGYLQACEKQGLRLADYDLGALRLVGATGSPLLAAASYWIDEQLSGRVPLVSTSGGTDIVTALAFWAPTVPIWPGRSHAGRWASRSTPTTMTKSIRDAVGELVVTAPMPPMPVSLWNDADGTKYRSTYLALDTYPGIWRHGDWVTITERGTVLFHGRSDATLNRNGVRLGSADIYEIVEAVPGVSESFVVGIGRPDGGYWMPLFVVLDEGVVLDDTMRATIVAALRRDASPRHVPDGIIATSPNPQPAPPHPGQADQHHPGQTTTRTSEKDHPAPSRALSTPDARPPPRSR